MSNWIFSGSGEGKSLVKNLFMSGDTLSGVLRWMWCPPSSSRYTKLGLWFRYTFTSRSKFSSVMYFVESVALMRRCGHFTLEAYSSATSWTKLNVVGIRNLRKAAILNFLKTVAFPLLKSVSRNKLDFRYFSCILDKQLKLKPATPPPHKLD